jgi:putative transposase
MHEKRGGRKYYNEERAHGAIGQKPPMMLLNHDGAASPPS